MRVGWATMTTTMDTFYDDLADHYHLIFEDWDRSILRQAAILSPLMERYVSGRALRILDCACGIGTQTIGLSMRGHHLVGSDLSPASVARARREVESKELAIPFYVADMRDRNAIPQTEFDVVLAADNALPHLLLQEDRDVAIQAMASKVRDGGILMLTIRDYDHLVQSRPATLAPSFYGERPDRRIVHQIWDWEGNDYDVHLYLSLEGPSRWGVRHFLSRYHALLRQELATSLRLAGLSDFEWLEPAETSFYQPILIARK
jgi:glycine/sarcosine N-methyltransferase